MITNKVTLDEVLRARDCRYEKQKRLIHLYKQTLIVLTLNIPGPEKVNDQINKVFEQACESIESQLRQFNKIIIYREKKYLKTGHEAYFVVKGRAKGIKLLMVDLEENHLLGRLFDIDVFSNQMKQLSRGELGVERRKCFVCDRLATECGRSRRHTEEEVQQALKSLLYKCT